MKKNIILIVIVLIWTVINICLILTNIKQNNKLEKTNDNANNTSIQENIVTEQEIEDDTNQKEIEQLKDADERTRIQQYCGKFIRYIENKQYDKAYDLLYPEFKQNYFKTQDDFKKYVQEKFPSNLITIDYENFERQGEYYILFTTITSPMKADYSMEQKFIIIEKDFNDFVLSFDVKQ